MVIDESLRLYPPAWGQPRQAIEDDEIDGYPIPRGAIISLSQWVTHRHRDFWERPDQFEPEGFEQEPSSRRPKFAYFPFGGGSRVCIGQQFALLEGQIALSLMASRYRFELPDHSINSTVEPDPTFTLIPRGGLRLKVKRRA